MVAHRVKRKSKKFPDDKMYRYYICSQYSNKDTSVYKPNLIDAEQTENYAVEKLLEFVSNPDLIEVITEQAHGNSKPDTARIEADILKFEQKLKDLKNKEDLYYDYLEDPKKLETLRKRKKLLHSLIKEIMIKQSDDFKTRTVEKIILVFEEADVLEYLSSSAKKENLKTFVPTCGTVNRIAATVVFINQMGALLFT